MNTPYAEKAAHLEQDMLEGKLGCVFAKHAAIQGKVGFVDLGSEADQRENITKALIRFTQEDVHRVLVGIPEQDPQTHEEGQEVALDLYQKHILALRKINMEIVDLLSAEMRIDIDAVMQNMDVLSMTEGQIHHQFQSEELQHWICNGFPRKGFVALEPIRYATEEKDLIVPFAMGSYYQPLREGHSHPRYARHFATMLTYDSDIQRAFAYSEQDIEATRRWETMAAGKLYAQGFHIGQNPLDREQESTIQVRT